MHQFHGGTVTYQSWTQGFNPRSTRGLLTPFWISFPVLPLEYLKLSHLVAAQVGTILAEEINHNKVPPARYCMGVDITQGWISTVVGHSALGGSAIIPVVYEGFELQCASSSQTWPVMFFQCFLYVLFFKVLLYVLRMSFSTHFVQLQYLLTQHVLYTSAI